MSQAVTVAEWIVVGVVLYLAFAWVVAQVLHVNTRCEEREHPREYPPLELATPITIRRESRA